MSFKDEKNSPQLSKCAQMKLILKNITVEPLLLCYNLPSTLAIITNQNLAMEKACRVNLALNSIYCDAISARNESSYANYKMDEAQVQKLTSNMYMWKSFITNLVACISIILLGSWSDRKQRRKPTFLLPIAAELVATCGFLICTYFFYQLPTEVNIFVEAMPHAFTGGWLCFFMSVSSYISAVSDHETRTIRLGAVHLFFIVSIGIANALSGICYQKLGFYGVYLINTCLYTIGLIYGGFFVKEVPKIQLTENDVVELEQQQNCSYLNVFQQIRGVIKVCFKNGKNNRRTRIIITIFLVLFVFGPMDGEMNVTYMYLRYKFDWGATEYSIFTTTLLIITFFGTSFALTLFTKILKWDDSILGIIACFSRIVARLIYAFAPTVPILYLGAFIEIFGGCTIVTIRAIVSKLVPITELGNVLSLFAVFEAIVPLIYGPLYSKIYSTTISTFPGAFYVVGAGLTLPASGIFLWLYMEHIKDVKEDELLKKHQEKLIK